MSGFCQPHVLLKPRALPELLGIARAVLECCPCYTHLTAVSLLLQERLSGVRIELVPIDHGFCLPEALEAPFFEWLYWGQASAQCVQSGSGPITPTCALTACLHAERLYARQ